MKLKSIAFAVTVVLSSSAYAGAYKCQVDGKTVYQQSPCTGQTETATEMKIVDNGKSTGLIKGNVKIGMSKDDVIWSWGKPTKINDSYVAGHVNEQWVYDRGNFRSQYLYFEDGLLKSWQNSN